MLITGACGYFGRELADAFAAEGAALTLLDLREPTAAQRDRLPPNTTFLQADLSNLEGIAALIAGLPEHAVPDVLVNNAGIFPFASVGEVDLALCRKIFDINVLAPLELSRRLSERWQAAGGIAGVILNVSSAAAEVARGNGAAYGPSKAALEQLTRILAVELASRGIRVNAARAALADDPERPHIPADHMARLAAGMPLGRTIRDGEFANVALFLCSDDASFVTGQVLACDGGGGLNRRPPAGTRT